VAGAPKFGDKAAWAPRIAAGKDHLYASALKGKGAMPPKGGQTQLADDAVKAAVDYMAAAAKEPWRFTRSATCRGGSSGSATTRSRRR
jgi:cytochrome c5